jgi:Flp pilus assembly protein TadD
VSVLNLEILRRTYGFRPVIVVAKVISQMPEPFTAIIPTDALDVSGLPPHARQPGTQEFKIAVSEMLAGDLQAFGLDGSIKVTDENITISWANNGEAEGSVERAVSLLRSGDYSRGIRLLQILEKLESGNPHLHFNLGAALSDKGKFDDARVQLIQAIQLDPSHIDARTTLGLTYARQGRHKEAIKVFEETAAKAPQNPFIWRALGGTLRLVPGRLLEAKECLLKATELAPTDPLSWLGYGDVCEKMELWEEASAAFQKCRNLNPPEALAEKAEDSINRLTSRSLRPRTETGEEMLRMDAVMYMQEALPLLAKMNPEQLKQTALELALAGQQGLDLKDPTPKHTLKSFPGVFSGMKIVSYMYAAFQQFMPGADVGIDLSKEYAAVKGK